LPAFELLYLAIWFGNFLQTCFGNTLQKKNEIKKIKAKKIKKKKKKKKKSNTFEKCAEFFLLRIKSH